MKMKCLYKSIFRGDVVKAGAVLDVTDAEAKQDVVKRFFVKVADEVEGGKTAPASVSTAASAAHPARVRGKAGTIAGLTREQVVMKLAQAGVTVNAAADLKAIEELYNQTFSNVAEVTEGAGK